MKLYSYVVSISMLGLLSNHAQALGFETLNTTGYPVSAGTYQPTGGTTAYKTCNPTGNYGSSIPTLPSSTLNNTCAIVPVPASMTSAPEAGFSLIPFGSRVRTVEMNNALTGGVTVALGSVQEAVFRNAALNQCIYATRVGLQNPTYLPGQYFALNGVARGGVAGVNEVAVAYASLSNSSDVVYRAGRTFTSVPHRATLPASAIPAPGYYNLPLTPGASASINGTPSGLASPAYQDAQLDANWVEFTIEAYASSGPISPSSKPFSPALYVKAPCANATLTEADNAIRLRQTMSNHVGNHLIEIRVRGFVPQGSNTNPVPIPGSNY